MHYTLGPKLFDWRGVARPRPFEGSVPLAGARKARPSEMHSRNPKARGRWNYPLRIALLTGLLLTNVHAVVLQSDRINALKVEIPETLRAIAGEGWVSRVKSAKVAIAVPRNFDPKQEWPVFIVLATSSAKFSSSCRLLEFYAPDAVAAGWVVIAADPDAVLKPYEDISAMRLALSFTALAALEMAAPTAVNWPVAIGGFSGGAKHAGWVSALFTFTGRRPIGVFQAGINQETLARTGREIGLKDPLFKEVPVYLLAGLKDRIASPADHRDIEMELRSSGFTRVRLETFPGPHAVNPKPLREALKWFIDLHRQQS